jgi:hypothetical protein
MNVLKFYDEVNVHETHATILENNSLVENIDVIKISKFYLRDFKFL